MITQGFYTASMSPIDKVRLDLFFDNRESVLVEELVYVAQNGRVHRVPAGFTTDGASIPPGFWRLIGTPHGVAGWPSNHPNYLPAAVVHDWYCIKSYDLKGIYRWRLRISSDKLFAEMLKYLGLPAWKISVMYLGVRAHALKAQFRP